MIESVVSFIIPVYKAENTIKRCINSIINQSVANWELVLIDDGSPDNSGLICDDYSQSDSRIIVIHKKNGGVSSARNAGIEIAHGEYVSFVDSDDFIEPDFIEKMLEQAPSDLIICGFKTLDADEFVPRHITGNLYSDSNLLKEMIDIPFYLDSPWCKLFRSSLIREYHLKFNTKLKLSEDTLFSYQYLKECKTVKTIPDILYTYDGQWGGDGKYSLSVEELTYASKMNVLAIKTLSKKFNTYISTRYKCFHYLKLGNVLENFIDRDIYNIYIQTHDNISIEEFLGDERLSPISYTIGKTRMLAKSRKMRECADTLKLLKNFITIPIHSIKFTNKKHKRFMNFVDIFGVKVSAWILSL